MILYPIRLQVQSSAEAPKVYTIGSTADFNGLQITLINAYTANSLGYSTPADGYIYVVTDWNVNNGTDKDQLVNSSNFEFYAGNQAYDMTVVLDDSIKSLTLGSIGAGRIDSGSLVYEVPANFSKAEIEVCENMFYGDTVTFEINH